MIRFLSILFLVASPALADSVTGIARAEQSATYFFQVDSGTTLEVDTMWRQKRAAPVLVLTCEAGLLVTEAHATPRGPRGPASIRISVPEGSTCAVSISTARGLVSFVLAVRAEDGQKIRLTRARKGLDAGEVAE